LTVRDFAAQFDEWLQEGPPSLAAATQAGSTTDEHMAAMRHLMSDLYTAGWSRFGWPERVGGLGGSMLHRAAFWDALARHGVIGMAAFEHLEVLGPTLLDLAPADFTARAFPRFLDGSEAWCQGFSEPDAGSDLATLRTRAVADGDGYTVSGRKIWTSWARFAKWCLLLARTGPAEGRHKTITALIVDVDSPGVSVRSLEQANGRDELAEVTFDNVFVPAGRVVGTVDGGWAVAMHILGHERGTFAWFRHCFLLKHLEEELAFAGPESDGLLEDALLDLAGVRAVSTAAIASREAGTLLGPAAAYTKLLLCSAEQSLNDWALAVDSDIAAGPFEGAAAEARAAYFFSRIVTIYGGSKQMQLDTVAKQILRLP
jgi:alkylation response protein AidB-like acyl-CoA dehydrogenase